MSYLSDLERSEVLVREYDYFRFKCVADLSSGIEIKLLDNKYDLANFTKRYPEKLAAETARFTMWWTINFHRKLNGFSGIDTVKFILS